ncbi:MAG: aldo/keto reductase [Capsulimonadales bacterium]|nr:aldo/keto reductase [Capsulimonadales bacterium]
MEKRTFGKTGLEVSVLGFGGAEIGFTRSAEDTVGRLLNSALDAGLNIIDTAECYSSGEEHPSSEELIGQAISHRRGECLLFTKCGHASRFPGETDWSPSLLEKSIDRSLQRLKTDYLDLIQLHSCDEATLRQGDVIEVLRKARAAGKTRFIGYSGDRDNARYAVESGAFDTLQTSVNIADQEAVELTLEKAQAAGMGVIAKRPVANVAWQHNAETIKGQYGEPYWHRLQELAYPFLATPDAVSIALRFTLSLPGVHTAIVGTQNPERWRQNAALLEAGPLDPDVIRAIRDRWNEVARPDWVGQT